MISISDKPIDVATVIDSVRSPEAGGIDVFIGTTRNNTKKKEVKKLEFESHVSMAVKEFEKIINQAKTQWPLLEVAVAHRLGAVEIGEEAVVIAVSAKHRDAAFQGCRYIIDTLKQTVPIWKKEIFEDGEVWVAAHP